MWKRLVPCHRGEGTVRAEGQPRIGVVSDSSLPEHPSPLPVLSLGNLKVLLPREVSPGELLLSLLSLSKQTGKFFKF